MLDANSFGININCLGLSETTDCLYNQKNWWVQSLYSSLYPQIAARGWNACGEISKQRLSMSVGQSVLSTIFYVFVIAFKLFVAVISFKLQPHTDSKPRDIIFLTVFNYSYLIFSFSCRDFLIILVLTCWLSFWD